EPHGRGLRGEALAHYPRVSSEALAEAEMIARRFRMRGAAALAAQEPQRVKWQRGQEDERKQQAVEQERHERLPNGESPRGRQSRISPARPRWLARAPRRHEAAAGRSAR